MRKHLSVLALGARQTLGRVLLLLVVLAAVETVLFGWALWTYLPQEMGGGMAGPAPVEELMEAVKLRWVYAAGMTAVFAVLLLTGLELRGSRMAYTMCRLRISEEAAVLWQGAYNALCFLLLWAVQTALALGFCLWYMAAVDPAFVTGQTAFLAFYRSGFLNGLLPLANTARWVQLITGTAALGLTTATAPYHQRYGRVGVACYVVLGVTVMSGGVSVQNWQVSVFAVGLFLVVLYMQAVALWTGWRAGDGRE